MPDALVASVTPSPAPIARKRRSYRRQPELATLAEIGRALLQAQLDEDELCELVYQLAGRIVPNENFQLGLFDGDRYEIKVWVKDGQRQPPATFTVLPGQGIVGWMRASHQPLLVHDFQAEMEKLPARPIYISQHPPRSAIFLPMLVGDSVIGAVSIQSPRPNAFDENHLRLLAILVNQSASAVNNARLYRQGQRRLNALTTIAEVGRKLTSILDLDELLTQVVQLIRDRFGYYHAQIFLVEKGSNQAMFRASSGHHLNEKWRRERRAMNIGREGIIGWVAEHGEILLANDVSVEPRYIPDDPRLLPDTRAELAVPLIVEGEVLGVLDVQSTQLNAFGQDDIFVLRTLADQVAVAVKSAQAYQAQREEAWITTVLLQVAAAASQATTMTDVLDAATRVTAMLAGVEAVVIWLWDDELEAFQYAASFGLCLDEPADSRAQLRFRPGEWPALDTLRDRRAPVVVAARERENLPAALAAYCPGDTLALLPMLAKGQVFGVMAAGISSELAPNLDERRLAMLSGIAQQIAAAVDNSRLTMAREEEAWISTMLLQVAEAIRRLQPIEVTLEQVTRLAPALTGVDRCAALLMDANGSYRVRTVHAQRAELADAYRDAVIQPGDLPLLDDACRLGQPLVVNDTADNPRVPETWRERFGSRTILAVPLLVADEPIGALLADDVDATHLFSPRRIRILSGIANQAAIAIENARLQAQEAERARLSRELELAHDIQRRLLPMQAPALPGYQIVYRWRSAREVGGDFFDFMHLAPDRLGLVVADVSDKGIPAALYMMFARTLLRVVAFSGRDPAAALARANELMLADSTSDMFVTAYYSVLDCRGHQLTYASAGHNLAYFCPADGAEPRPMITRGIALGIVEEAEFEQKTLKLAPGDVVLFYTDGAVDALNAQGEAFGEERLAALLQGQRHAPAEVIADAIDAAVREFAATTPQYDDFTLILIKREE
ncbi:MAG: GAF domain-containing protein [Anaerolineae bacterium]|nr:GAF domain-containing protein [Anaerolineae bacterium]